MSNQPLNTTISVLNRVRVQKQEYRHEAVKALTGNGIRPMVVSVPGEEKLIGQIRDATTGVVTTSLTHGRSTGLPIVRIPEAFLPVWAVAAASMYTTDSSGTLDTTLDFPVRIPGMRDFQIQKKAAFVAENIQGSAQTRHTGLNL